MDVYQAEYQISVDEGSGPFSQRKIYGGFKHSNAGALIAGKFDSPLKKTQGDIDQFDDLTLLAVGADYKVAGANKVFTCYSMVEADKGTQDDSYFDRLAPRYPGWRQRCESDSGCLNTGVG